MEVPVENAFDTPADRLKESEVEVAIPPAAKLRLGFV
jgi:hypothetical protein